MSLCRAKSASDRSKSKFVSFDTSQSIPTKSENGASNDSQSASKGFVATVVRNNTTLVLTLRTGHTLQLKVSYLKMFENLSFIYEQ